MKKIISLVLIVIPLIFVACTFNYADYSDNKIIATTDNYSANTYTGNIDNDQKGYYVKIEKMQGVRQIAYIDLKKDCNFDISYTVSAIGGKFKIVHVKPNNEVIIIKEIINGNGDKILGNTTLNCKIGLNKIKIVSENCININLNLRDLTQTLKYEGNDNLGQMFDKDFPFKN